jgi:hypothetical protein
MIPGPRCHPGFSCHPRILIVITAKAGIQGRLGFIGIGIAIGIGIDLLFFDPDPDPDSDYADKL